MKTFLWTLVASLVLFAQPAFARVLNQDIAACTNEARATTVLNGRTGITEAEASRLHLGTPVMIRGQSVKLEPKGASIWKLCEQSLASAKSTAPAALSQAQPAAPDRVIKQVAPPVQATQPVVTAAPEQKPVQSQAATAPAPAAETAPRPSYGEARLDTRATEAWKATQSWFAHDARPALAAFAATFVALVAWSFSTWWGAMLSSILLFYVAVACLCRFTPRAFKAIFGPAFKRQNEGNLNWFGYVALLGTLFVPVTFVTLTQPRFFEKQYGDLGDSDHPTTPPEPEEEPWERELHGTAHPEKPNHDDFYSQPASAYRAPRVRPPSVQSRRLASSGARR